MAGVPEPNKKEECKGEERIHGHRWWSTRWDDPHSIIGKTAYEGISGGIDVQGDEGLSESEDEEEPTGSGAATCTPPGEDNFLLYTHLMLMFYAIAEFH